MKIMQVSDEILITRVAHGDSHALEMLYDRHAAMVLGILVQNPGRAYYRRKSLARDFLAGMAECNNILIANWTGSRLAFSDCAQLSDRGNPNTS